MHVFQFCSSVDKNLFRLFLISLPSFSLPIPSLPSYLRFSIPPSPPYYPPIFLPLQNNSVAEKLYSALTEGYKEEVRWWGAWDLLRRVLLIILIVTLPGRTVSWLVAARMLMAVQEIWWIVKSLCHVSHLLLHVRTNEVLACLVDWNIP